MVELAVDNAKSAIIRTNVVALLGGRLAVTHEKRGIAVFSGPWGIGKTTAIDAFARTNTNVVIVKVPRSSSKAGTSPIVTTQHVIESVRRYFEKPPVSTMRESLYGLRHRLNDLFQSHFWDPGDPNAIEHSRLTLIFDEAQYLSEGAIEMLRYWNDNDRCEMPFPIGIVFIGNQEFSLDDRNGESKISGAVRSRAMFYESLTYAEVSDADVGSFLRSRGVSDQDAIRAFLDHLKRSRTNRDFRNLDRMIEHVQAVADGAPVTSDLIGAVLRAA